ncbi:hypothetical protein [Stieleria varia]|uniref:Uncharacterized protein n=1 Tax=Stieleria varia TaxID=2528005 RepID=A0A5C6ARY6_9BACT|nr:hypothetical protein [Stieleria varia]TWU02783.1 hypothetical protein Pla52n_38420 [Stieleria varia]
MKYFLILPVFAAVLLSGLVESDEQSSPAAPLDCVATVAPLVEQAENNAIEARLASTWTRQPEPMKFNVVQEPPESSPSDDTVESLRPAVQASTNGCDCVDCKTTVLHPVVTWEWRTATLVAEVYEPVETAEQYCECIENNGVCETTVGVKNVRKYVKRIRKWNQRYRYPVIKYVNAEVPVRCGKVVPGCPSVPLPPVPGNALLDVPADPAVRWVIDSAPPVNDANQDVFLEYHHDYQGFDYNAIQDVR